MKPPFQYFGGKASIASQIVFQFPEHTHYVEPFAGSLAVLLTKTPAQLETVNDLNKDIVNFWRIVRDQPEEFERKCQLTPYSRSEYELARSGEECSDVERARRFWVRVEQGYAHTGGETGWRMCHQPTNLDSRNWNHARRIPAVAERIRNIQLDCRPALELISECGKHSHVLLYCDPPYLAVTREPGQYMSEMEGESEHRELAEALNMCKARVALSGYDSDLYRELYKDWHREEIITQTGTGKQGKRSRTEILWMNYQPAEDLFSQE